MERADDGSRLVEERGELLRLALDKRLSLSNGGAVQATAGVAAGRLDYQGQTQGGAPVATRTGQRDLDAALAWRPFAPGAWGEGWVTLQLLSQRRQIASTAAAGGLRETSQLLMSGLRWTHAWTAAGWRFAPAAELRASVWHRLDVEAGGAFDDAELKGGPRRELALRIDAKAADSPWTFGLEWTRSRESASPRQDLFRDGARIGTIRQPKIEMDTVGVQVRRAF